MASQFDPQPAQLSPPQLRRSRASSTNLRPPLTLDSLAPRRRSSFETLPQLPIPRHTSLFSLPPPPKPAARLSIAFMPFGLFSRAYALLRGGPSHSSRSSPMSSPRSSCEDEYILPVSASAHITSFNDDPHKLENFPSRTPRPWWQDMPSIHAPMVFVVILFPLSTAAILLCLWTLPISVPWPQTLADLAQLGRELQGYSQSGLGPRAHVVGVLAITAVWKHAWSIPGSVLWNVLAGALFSPVFATLLMAVLTTIGSLGSSLLSTPLSPLLTHFFPRALALTRNALEGGSHTEVDRSDAKTPPWVRLSVLRLIGVVPWSGINIACGVCGVALFDCSLGTFIGTLPWTAVTCQIGDILQTVASTPSPTTQTIQSLLFTPEIMIKLILLTVLSLAPILGREYLKALIAAPSEHKDGLADDVSSWTWAMQWRTRLARHKASSSVAVSDEDIEIQEMVREKMGRP